MHEPCKLQEMTFSLGKIHRMDFVDSRAFCSLRLVAVRQSIPLP